MTHLTDPLTVYECNLEPRRYGKDNDGGYVIFGTTGGAIGEPVLNYDAFLSGGICDENSFERDVLRRYPELVCHAYDPSSGPGVWGGDRYHFHPERVPVMGLESVRRALVKLDIEGDEWDWLQSAPFIDHVAQFVIELHSPHLGRWSWPELERLARTHALIHAHGNNWDGIVDIEGVRVPGTLETTWVRRDLAGELRQNTRPIPGPLDMPNRVGVADHVIDWAPFVWSPA